MNCNFNELLTLSIIITDIDHRRVELDTGSGSGQCDTCSGRVQCPPVIQIHLFPAQVTHQLSASTVVADVGGGQRSELLLELDLGPGQVTRYKVCHSSTRVITWLT